MRKLFELLVNNKLELCIVRCKFLYTKLDYLGYTISHDISPNSQGIEAVLNFPISSSIHDVRVFVRLCSYFRKFIKKFSVIAKLYDLLRKDIIFKFGENELQTVQVLKEALTKALILALYSSHDETKLYCDASTIG